MDYLYNYCRIFRFFLLFGFILFNSVGCKSYIKNSEDKFTFLAASGYNSIIYFDWKRLYNERRIAEIANASQLKPFINGLSIDDKMINYVYIFGNFSEKRRGVILTGKFTNFEKRFNNSVSKTDINQFKAFLLPDQTNYIALIDDNNLLIGEKNLLVNVTFNLKNRKNSVDSGTKRLINNITLSQKPFSMMILFDENLSDIGNSCIGIASFLLDLTVLPPIDLLLGKISLPKGFAINLSSKDKVLLSDLYFLTKNEKTTEIISGSLKLLKNLSAAIPKENLTLQEIRNYESIQSIKVSRNKNLLEISMEIQDLPRPN